MCLFPVLYMVTFTESRTDEPLQHSSRQQQSLHRGGEEPNGRLFKSDNAQIIQDGQRAVHSGETEPVQLAEEHRGARRTGER